jgi:hypothetical protein
LEPIRLADMILRIDPGLILFLESDDYGDENGSLRKADKAQCPPWEPKWAGILLKVRLNTQAE